MKTYHITLIGLLFFADPCTFAGAQDAEYRFWKKTADSLLLAQKPMESAMAFSRAFEIYGWRGRSEDRYTAARAWALAGVPDSAFFQLNKLVDKAGFREDEKLGNEADFNTLHSDFRWSRLLNNIHLRKEKEAGFLTDPLVQELTRIRYYDQWYRTKRDSVLSVNDLKSPGFIQFSQQWKIQDSLNYIRITAIIDSVGWLSPDDVGDYAAKTFYLVIQHAPLAIQEKYLPVMQKAVKDGKASITDLAYLEDRILMRQGKPQRYGSQIKSDPETGAWLLYPVEDPANIDKRRQSVGLGPIAQYLESTGAIWKQ